LNLTGIDWVIVGGESGPGAGPMKKEWVTAIRDACVKSSIPVDDLRLWFGAKGKLIKILRQRALVEVP
jgi:protein gp37